jgi:hypothetical protein
MAKTEEQLRKDLAAAQEKLRKQQQAGKRAKRNQDFRPSFPGQHRGY